MIHIHLYLKDQEYQSKLADMLAAEGRVWEFHRHTQAERPEERLRAPQEKSLWLISPEYAEVAGRADAFLFMTEAPSSEAAECFCYQPIFQIRSKIIERLYQLGIVEAAPLREEKVDLIYLYSPFGGIGVSSLAYELALELGKRERTLLLSFDAYHIFSREFIPFRLSDLLFYWQSLGKANVQDFCLRQGGTDILHGPLCQEDLQVLRQRGKKEFMQMLCQGGYQRIVLDLSSSEMQSWCRPTEPNEFFFAIRRVADKWKQFAAGAGFDYIALTEGGGTAEILRELGGRENADEILPANYRRRAGG